MSNYIQFKSPEEMETIKEIIQDRFNRDQEQLYIREVKKILEWFRDKFPKRTLKWVDGMGTNFWVIDDEIWHEVDSWHYQVTENGKSRTCKERAWDRKQQLLKPLVDFYNSINDCTYTHQGGVQIGDWQIDRISREIV